MKINENSRVRAIKNGLVLEQDGSSEEPHNEGSFCISVIPSLHIFEFPRQYQICISLGVRGNEVR